MKFIKVLFLMSLLISTSCVRTYIVPQDVINQRITHERLSHKESMSLANVLTIPLAGIVITKTEAGMRRDSDLNWLPAISKKGDTIEVEVTRNSTFIITTKSNETIKMLATTAFIDDGILKGRRSRLAGMPREISIDSISGISLYTENSKTRAIKK